MPEADVPFNYFEIDADKGDTVFAASGSILVFPAQSLVDNKGKPVTGKVSIRFREFADALDQYLAGIPMTFDSAGGKIQFVSSGMCEIKALKDNQPVFVNPDRKPTIHLLSTNANINDQLYYFDTVSNRWIADGKITTTYPDRKPAITKKKTPILATTPALITPVLPVQATGNSPVLKVKIDPGSFGEFSRFNNLRFEVDERVRKFDPKDADEEWNDVSLERQHSLENIYLNLAMRAEVFHMSPVRSLKEMIWKKRRLNMKKSCRSSTKN